MPIYGFHCEDCDCVFELQRKIADRDDSAKCPDCGSEKTKRELGSFVSTQYNKLHFKSQSGEQPKRKQKIHLGYQTKPKRWGFSKPIRDERLG